jgi:capsular exopolysaccharide synthesis family protein
MRLQEFRGIAPLRSLLITSALPQDGKSTMAANLATALAERGNRKVLLIEGDLHRPVLAEKLGLSSRPGLGECLEEDRDPWTLVRRLEPLGWYFLPAGNCKGNPTELVQTDACARVVDRLSGHFDWVIFDSPPLVPLSDAIAISKHVDATLLVVRAGCTPADIVKQAVNKIGQKNLLGIILNAAEGLDALYSTYGSYYTRKNSTLDKAQ